MGVNMDNAGNIENFVKGAYDEALIDIRGFRGCSGWLQQYQEDISR